MNAIETDGLRRFFGREEAVAGIDLRVPEGSIFGLLGENGAGKTTTIRILTGLLKPSAGTVRVLGLDPVRDAIAVKRGIGYLPEARSLYGRMRVGEIIEFTSSFYPSWDEALVESYRRRFGLETAKRIEHLSRGMYAKLSLLLALGHRPPLLILDEPSYGLDPLIRREFLEVLVEVVMEQGRTVFLSSHLLDEIDRVADHVGFMRGGKIIVQGKKDDLMARTRRVRLPIEITPPFDGRILRVVEEGRERIVTVTEWSDEDEKFVRELAPGRHEIITPGLEDLFVEYMTAPPC